MKKFKYFILFIFLVFFLNSAYAVTIQGCGSITMQGCDEANAFSGGELIDEEFPGSSIPSGWTNSTNAAVVSGEAVFTVTASTERMDPPDFADQSEFWTSFDVTLDSGAVITNTATGKQKIFIAEGTSQDIIRFNYRFNGSAIEYNIDDRRNAGITPTPIPALPVQGVEDQIVIHWKKETAPAAGDSILQVWVNNNLEIDLTGMVNDSRNDINSVTIGGVGPDATSTYVVRMDNFKVGTTGSVS